MRNIIRMVGFMLEGLKGINSCFFTKEKSLKGIVEFEVNDYPVKVFLPGVWGEFPVVMVEVDIAWNYNGITKTILKLINKYQISPFSYCFVLAVRGTNRFKLVRFIKADVKFKKEIEKNLEVKNLKYLVTNAYEEKELAVCLKTFKVVDEVLCIWKKTKTQEGGES